jgi:hypothetical protein
MLVSFSLGSPVIYASDDDFFKLYSSEQNKTILQTLVGNRIFPAQIDEIIEPILSEFTNFSVYFKGASVWMEDNPELVSARMRDLLGEFGELTQLVSDVSADVDALKNAFVNGRVPGDLIDLVNRVCGDGDTSVIAKITVINSHLQDCRTDILNANVPQQVYADKKAVGDYIFKKLIGFATTLSSKAPNVNAALVNFFEENPQPLAADIASMLDSVIRAQAGTNARLDAIIKFLAVR